MHPITKTYGAYTITTDKNALKPDQIHNWLSTRAYWCKQIPYRTVKQAFDNSFCIGIIHGEQQIGYARLVTDYATFGYLADVYVTEEHRSKGLSKIMMETLMNIDWVKGLRRMMLATVDAHTLYESFGFAAPLYPDRLMEITRPEIYGDTKNPCK